MVSNLTFPSNGIENDFPTGKERQGYLTIPTALGLLSPSIDKAAGEDGNMLKSLIRFIILFIMLIVEL